MPKTENHILDWLLMHFPGDTEDRESSLFVRHRDGTTSTFWRWPNAERPKSPKCLNGFYKTFEAADLLSSTFRVSSPAREIVENGVKLVYSQKQLMEIVVHESVGFPSRATPFMMQTGNWIYAYTSRPDRIWEWDLEYPEDCVECAFLVDILDEWRKAVAEDWA